MTLLPQRSPLSPRPQSLQVALTSYQSPVSLYRRILRLAQTLAARWDDDAIFHANRHLAQRCLKQREQHAPAKGEDDESAASGQKATSIRVTIDQYRPFKRLKAHLSVLTRAEQGQREPMQKVLDWTYARRGVLRWNALRPFLDPCVPATKSQPAPPSPALIALLDLDALRRGAKVPEFTFPLPREGKTGGHPSQKWANKARNMTATNIKRRLTRLNLPMGAGATRRIEVNASSPEIRAEPSPPSPSSSTSTKSQGREQLHPLHPSAEHFARQKRRTWAWMLNEIPILAPPPPLPGGATNMALERLASHYRRAQSPADRGQHRFWLTHPRLPTDEMEPLVRAWNEHLTLAPGLTLGADKASAGDEQEDVRSKDAAASADASGEDSIPTTLTLGVSIHAMGKNDRGSAAAGQMVYVRDEADDREQHNLEEVSRGQAKSSASGSGAKQQPTTYQTDLPKGTLVRTAGKTKAQLGSHRFVSKEEADWARTA